MSGEFFTLTGNNFGATPQPFELSRPHAGAGVGKSVWYKWTAPLDGSFVITTAGSHFDTVLAIYTLDDPARPVLDEVASNDDRSAIDWTSQVTIDAIGGTDYYLAVDSYSELSAGDFTLSGLRVGQLAIVRQPQDARAPVGGRAEFSVQAVGGDTSLEYQWFHESNPLPGETEERLSLDPVRADDFGAYHVVVRSPSDTLVSGSAVLSEERLAPTITWSSGQQSLLEGSPLTMGVQVRGSAPLSYRWFKDGLPVAEWTGARVSVAAAQAKDSGLYRVAISNDLGAAVEEFQVRVVQSEFETLAAQYGTGREEILAIVPHGAGWLALSWSQIHRSADGIAWESFPLPRDFRATHVVATSTGVVVTGLLAEPAGQTAVARSTNLLEWTLTPLDFFRDPRAMVAIDELLVGVFNGAGNHVVVTSTDGVDWTAVIVMDPGGLPALIHTDSLSVVNGVVFARDDQSGSVFSSTDGFTWAKREHLPDVFWNGRYFALGNETLSSADLVAWEPEEHIPMSSQEGWLGSLGEEIIKLRADNARVERFGPSTNGAAITSIVDPANGNEFTAAHFSERGLVVGTSHGHLGLATELGELTFPVEPAVSFGSISWHDGRWFAAGQYQRDPDDFETILLASSDGRRWERDRLGPANIQFLGWHGRYWWAPARLFSSPSSMRGHSLQTLQAHQVFAPDGSQRFLEDLTSHRDTLLAKFENRDVRPDKTVLGVSWDGGESWSFPPDAPISFSGIDFANGTWFLRNALPANGSGRRTTWRSTNALTWEPVEFTSLAGSPTDEVVSDRIVYHRGMYYAVSQEETTDSGPILLRSTDGVRWLQSEVDGLREPTNSPQLHQVGGNLVIGFSFQGLDPVVGYSSDGRQWFRVNVPADTSALHFHGDEGVIVSRSSGIHHLPASRRHEIIFTETWNSPGVEPAGQTPLWTTHLGGALALPEITAGDRVEGDRAFEIAAGGYAYLNLSSETGAAFQPRSRYRITLRAARTSAPAGNRLEFGLWAGVPGDPDPLTPLNEAALTTPSLGTAGVLNSNVLPGNTMLELPYIDDPGEIEFLFETGDVPPTDDLVLFLRNNSDNAAPVYLDYVRLSADVRSTRGANAAPIVEFANLGDPASISLNSTLPIEVEAADPDGTIARVEFYLDGVLVGTDSDSPYSHKLRFEQGGVFTLTARAVDDSGAHSVAAVPLEVVRQALENRVEPTAVPVIPGPRSWSGEPGEGRDLVTAYLGFLWRSADGRAWTRIPLPVANNSFEVIEGRGSLLLRDGNSFYASRDGLNWTRTLSLPGDRTNIRVEVLSGRYVIRGFNGGRVNIDHLLVSADGFAWEESFPSLTTARIPDAIPSEDFSVWVGFHQENGLSYSLDGGNYWHPVSGPSPQRLVDRVVLHEGAFFGCDGAQIWSSADGIAWNPQGNAFGEVSAFFALGGRLFARTHTGTWISQDGTDWSFSDSPQLDLNRGLVWSESGYVSWLKVRGGPVWHSPDGLAWTEVTAGLPEEFEVQALTGFGANYYLTTRNEESFLWDGTSEAWELVYDRPPSRPHRERLVRIGGGNGIMVAAGEGNWIRSTDHGVSWQEVSVPANSGDAPIEIEHRDGMLLALFDDELWSSSDGDDWGHKKDLPDPQIASVFWGATAAYLRANSPVFGAQQLLYVVPLDQPGWTQLPALPGVDAIRHFGAIGSQPFAIGQPDLGDNSDIRWYTLSGNLWTDRGNFPLRGSNLDIVEAHGLLVVTADQPGLGPPLAYMDLAGPQVWNTEIEVQVDVGGVRLTPSPDGFLAWGSEYWAISADLSNWQRIAPFVAEPDFAGLFGVASFDHSIVILDDRGGIFVVPNLDLALEFAPPPDPADYRVGDTLEFDLLLRNPGSEASRRADWMLETWFSNDARIGDLDDQLISTVPLEIDPPAPGAEVSIRHAVQIPGDLEAGDFRLLVRLRRLAAAEEINSFNNDAVTLEAVVRIALRRLEIRIDGEGAVDVNNLREFYPDGAVVNLFARANKGSVFTGWSGDAQGGLAEATVVMDADRQILAGFSPVAHLAIRIRGAGGVVQSRSGGVYDLDETATLQAIPEPGWVFAGWSGDLTGAFAGESLLMSGNRTVAATFVLPYVNWKAMQFSETELNNPAISGDDLDLDGDGLALWQEYLRAGDPRDDQSPAPIVWQASSGSFSMIFTRLAGTEVGYDLLPQASLDLADWNSPGPEVRVLATTGASETVEARIPRDNQAQAFLRLHYARP